MSLASPAGARPPRPPSRGGRGLVRSRLLALAGLLGATLTVGALSLWQGRRVTSREADREVAQQLFTWTEAADVRALELTTPEGRVVIKHLPGEQVPWRITEPRATAAEAMAVDSLLRTVLGAKTRAEVPGGEGGGSPDAALFGLDSPRIVLTVTGPDAQQERLEVGHKNTFDDSLFVRVRGREAVAICPASVEQALDKRFFDLRDKRVLTLPSTSLREVVVEAEGTAGYTLAQADEAWRLVAPLSAPASRTQADALVGAIVGLRAKAFVSETGTDPALVRAHGLDRPLYRATVTDETQARATLRVGRRSDGPSDVFFAQIEPAGPIVELGSDWVVKKLSMGTWDLRDRHLAALTSREVGRVVIRGEGRTLTVVKDADPAGGEATWRAESEGATEAPRREVVDRQKVLALIDRLRDAEASGVAAESHDGSMLARLGLDAPALAVRLEGDDLLPGDHDAQRPLLADLRVGRELSGERLATNMTGGPIWRLAAAALDGISPSIEALMAAPDAAPEASARAGEGG